MMIQLASWAFTPYKGTREIGLDVLKNPDCDRGEQGISLRKLRGLPLGLVQPDEHQQAPTLPFGPGICSDDPNSSLA